MANDSIDLRRTSADLIVTLGAGSLTDGAKVASFVGVCFWLIT
jgi:alcohol dehydrogenase class IV